MKTYAIAAGVVAGILVLLLVFQGGSAGGGATSTSTGKIFSKPRLQQPSTSIEQVKSSVNILAPEQVKQSVKVVK